ncbi:MAG TPA: histidine kinase [Baekduia sp.]|nr:histidine kinase [Baekduia sp.]
MGNRDRSIGRWVPLALVPVAVLYSVTATRVAIRHGDLTTYAGRSAGAAAVELAAGLTVIGAGVVTWWLRPARAWGALAIVAGMAWFAPDFIGWQLGPGAVRIIAVAVQGAAAAAVAQLVLTTAGQSSARPLAAAIWTLSAVVAIGRVLFYDPLADPACVAYCAANPLLVAGDRAVARALDWVDSAVALIAALAVLAATIDVARRPAMARRSLVAILVPALVFLSAWALHATALAVSPGDDPHRGVLVVSFALRAMAMAAVGAGLLWAISRARRGARALRRLTADGSLQTALARATQDASLRVAFPLTGDGGWIDGEGEPVMLPAREGTRAVSLITREDRPIAAVLHDLASLDAATLQQEMGAAAQLAVDNERLRAEARAQLRELRTSRARMVEAGDAERRRLERDLHDGAQQRLVGLCLVLAMARETCSVPALEAADADLHGAIDELRDLARGIHPVELSDEGLAAALEALADRATVPMCLTALPEQRAPRNVETAGYVLVDEVLRLARERGDGATLNVAARRSGDVLAVEVHDERAASAHETLAGLIAVADRVSALEGQLTAETPRGGGVLVRAELPCA